MKFPQEFLHEVKEKNDIVEVAADYFDLEKRGGVYQAKCKHGDKNSASLTFFPDTQSFYCFGCGAGSKNDTGSSDVIAFVQWTEECGWQEAVEILAQRANVFIPQDTYSEDDKRKLRILNEMIGRNRQYWKNLQARPEVMEYLASRGIDKEDIDRWRIGYSEGNDRVAFAIMDEQSKTVGFGYRTLTGQDPKYINSKESLIFKKGNLLYGLNFVKKLIREKGYIVVVEGFTDVIQLQKYGVPAVGIMGTALTKDQVELIKRYTNTVVLFLDGDSAGATNTLKHVSTLNAEKMVTKVFRYSNDPDELALEYKEKSCLIIEEESTLASMYQLGLIITEYIGKEAEIRLKAVNAIKEKVTPLVHNVDELAICIQRIEEILRINGTDVLTDGIIKEAK